LPDFPVFFLGLGLLLGLTLGLVDGLGPGLTLGLTFGLGTGERLLDEGIAFFLPKVSRCVDPGNGEAAAECLRIPG